MMSNRERLVYMVNQIARNLSTMGKEEAAAATADHLTSFWDPRMKAQILEQSEMDQSGLSPIAADAVERLRACSGPTGKMPATVFNAANEAGHSDAG